jgi:lactoylglutathione lyase
MAALSHIAIKVDDLEAAREFYVQVFGFTHVWTNRVRDHVSCHLTDGNIDLALIQYDAGADSAEAKAAGAKPAIHHIGFAVADVAGCLREIERRGCTVISDPGVVPIKFRAPGGTVAEIAPAGHFKGAKAEG